MSSASTVASAPAQLPAPSQATRDKILLVLGLLLAWQVLAMLAGPQVLTSPYATARKLAQLMARPDFAENAIETGTAFGIALVISLAGGLGLGVALGAHRLSGEVAEPLLVGLYSIPKITLYPIVLLLFGLGMSARVAFGAMHGIIPVVLFTMAAVRSIPPVYIRAAHAMRLTPAQMFTHVLVPASLPEIITGFRFGFSLTLLGTLIGEMFASQRGIGYMLVKAMESNDTDVILALALLLVVLATMASWVLLALERRVHGRFAA